LIVPGFLLFFGPALEAYCYALETYGYALEAYGYALEAYGYALEAHGYALEPMAMPCWFYGAETGCEGGIGYRLGN
jgi:hypothetical protein